MSDLCVRSCRFSIATTPSLQDGIAKELSDNGLLAHGEDREPRLPEFDDLPKLPYLTAVRPLLQFLPHPCIDNPCSTTHKVDRRC